MKKEKTGIKRFLEIVFMTEISPLPFIILLLFEIDSIIFKMNYEEGIEE